jgi:GcrA cell cycle regulator
MNAPAFDWTEARIEEMLTMWSTGYTTYQIADKFGVSRNTICGKLHRVKIARGISEAKPRIRRPSTTDKPRKERKMPLPARAGCVLAQLPVTSVAAPDEGHLASIIDVTGCKWPVKDDEAYVGGVAFCNHGTLDGSSYCPYHKAESVASYSRTLISKTVRTAWHVYNRKVAA